jgi:hypothetical protein
MSQYAPDPPTSSLTDEAPAQRDFYDPSVGLVTDEWEINFSEVKFEKEIGSGSFGRGNFNNFY